MQFRAALLLLLVLLVTDWLLFDGYYWVMVLREVRHFVHAFLGLDWAGFLS